MKSKRQNQIIPILLVAVFITAIVGYMTFSRVAAPIPVPHGDKIDVVVSFYPLAAFAQAIGGERVNVKNLTPAGSEPHDFDPSPGDIVDLQRADVFVYNGAGFEPWAARMLPDVLRSGVTVVNSTEGIDLLRAAEDADEHDDEEDEEHSQYDPHVWLDPVLAAQQVDNIAAGLIRADPEGRRIYESNAEAFKEELNRLDKDYRTQLSDCVSRDIVVSHNSFAYPAARYDLRMMSIAGLTPDAEPSPRRLAEIVEFAKEHDVKHIFFETLVSPKLSETIAREIGAQTHVLNPLEGLSEEELSAGLDYLSVSRQNLDTLSQTLGCQ